MKFLNKKGHTTCFIPTTTKQKKMARRHRDLDDAPKGKLSRESFKDAVQIFQYIKPYQWYFVAGLVLLFLSSLVFMLFPYLIGLMVDVAQGKSTSDISLEMIGWFMAIVLLTQGVISYGRVITFAIVSEKGTADIRKAVFKKMAALPITFFEETRSGI